MAMIMFKLIIWFTKFLQTDFVYLCVSSYKYKCQAVLNVRIEILATVGEDGVTRWIE